MKNISTKGFSILHMLPMVAVVALIAFVGIQVLKPSQALTSTIYCTASYYKSGTTVTYRYTVKNNSSSTILGPNNRLGYVESGRTYWTTSFWGPGLKPGQSYIKSGTLKAFGRNASIKTVAQVYAFGSWRTCDGSKYVTVP